jgi:ankyrin repeat protein
VAGRQTALAAACREGYLEIVKSLLAKGANVNETETSNESALSAATERGDLEIVKLLLAKGADPNIKDGYPPPLIQASMGGFPEIVQMLLDKGAEVNAVDDTGRTALIWAAQYAFVYQQSTMSLLGQESPTLTEVTMDYKKGRRGKGQFVYEQIMLGQAGPFKSVDPVEADERRRKVVVALLAKGADVNARSKDGCTPLMTANELNHAEIASLLVNAGARP